MGGVYYLQENCGGDPYVAVNYNPARPHTIFYTENRFFKIKDELVGPVLTKSTSSGSGCANSGFPEPLVLIKAEEVTLPFSWPPVGPLRIIKGDNPGQSNMIITLWDSFQPTSEVTNGRMIDVSEYTQAVLNFDWQPGTAIHTCQYAYRYSNDGLTTSFNSSFLYFSPDSCRGSVSIPLNSTPFLAIDAYTPPSGILNATLTLTR